MSRARLAAAWLLLCRAGPWTANAQAVKAAEAAVARDAHDDANAPNAAAPPRRRSYFVNLVVASEDPFLLVNVQYFLRHAATHSAQADAEYKVTMNGPCPETRRLLREHAALVGPQAPLKRAPVRQLQRKNFGYDFGGHLDALAEEAACCPRGFEGHTACLWLVGGVDTSQKSPSVVCGTSAAARAAAASGKTRKNAAPAAGGAAPRGHRALEAGDVATGDVATGDVAAGALEARKTAGATAPRAAVAMAARAAASGNGEKFRRNLHWSNLRYDGYILLNCGVRGPIYPTYMPRGWHWLSAFEDKMTALGRSSGGVALVGTSLACLDEPAAPYGGGIGPRVEGFAFGITRSALLEVFKHGTSFSYHKDKTEAVVRGEYALSLSVLGAAGKEWNIGSLMRMHHGANFRDQSEWHCNGHAHPTRIESYEGMTVHPLEVLFHKGRWHTTQEDPNKREMDVYTGWINSRGLRQR